MVIKEEMPVQGEIRSRGLETLRFSADEIDDIIERESFHTFPGTTTTVCALTLTNGFVVLGHSSSASVASFDRDKGQEIAERNARDRILLLAGLKDRAATRPVIRDLRPAPSIGGVVRYVHSEGRLLPAVITDVNVDGTIGLHVLGIVSGAALAHTVQHSDAHEPQTYHWPARD